MILGGGPLPTSPSPPPPPTAAAPHHGEQPPRSPPPPPRRTMVSLLRLLGLSAKHLRLDVSTTVSQNDTTGSATLTSTSGVVKRG